jgi:hypothetical protein
MSPLHGTTAEQLRYLEAAEIIHRARKNAGVKLPPYSRHQWNVDQQLMRDSANRKKALRREERERLEMLDGCSTE